MRSYILALSFLCLISTGCTPLQKFWAARSYEIRFADSSPSDTTVTQVTANRDSQGRPAILLSAFFGLDDALPSASGRFICEGAGGKDGMPIIFSHEIDVSTMQAGDFRVTTASGMRGEITCVTLAPADDKGEFRTALLVGHYGSIDDQPVKVEIVGNLLSMDNSLNFKGASAGVVQLEDGPSMVFAEVVPEGEWELDKKATPLPFGGGNGCPFGTRQVVRVVWAGGVTKPGGEEVDDVERLQYKVTVLQENGSTIKVTPFALGDLGDGDNNHELCLDVAGAPQSVFFPAGYMTDPREDLNPATTIRIQK
jgi:hypothetical protein